LNKDIQLKGWNEGERKLVKPNHELRLTNDGDLGTSRVKAHRSDNSPYFKMTKILDGRILDLFLLIINMRKNNEKYTSCLLFLN